MSIILYKKCYIISETISKIYIKLEF